MKAQKSPEDIIGITSRGRGNADNMEPTPSATTTLVRDINRVWQGCRRNYGARRFLLQCRDSLFKDCRAEQAPQRCDGRRPLKAHGRPLVDLGSGVGKGEGRNHPQHQERGLLGREERNLNGMEDSHMPHLRVLRNQVRWRRGGMSPLRGVNKEAVAKVLVCQTRSVPSAVRTT